MSDKEILLTVNQAIEALKEGKTIHCFISTLNVLVGADHDREEVLKTIKTSERIQIGGPGCMSLEHPLVVWEGKTPLFYEAKMEVIERLKSEAKNAS